MGLIANIYRSDYDSDLNAFHGKRQITITNADGPFQPTADAPAAHIARGPLGHPIIVADGEYLAELLPDGGNDMIGPMAGGTFAETSDSRFGRAIRKITGTDFYGALAIHDRYETYSQYESLSR